MNPFRSQVLRRLSLHALAILAAVALLSVGSVRVKAASALYTVTDLGSLGCCNYWIWESAAAGINNAGQIVGVSTSSTDPNVVVPFIYRDGTMTAIGNASGYATAINDAGQVTGFIYVEGGRSNHAFLYQEGVFTDLGGLPGSSNLPTAAGYAINNAGTIVGQSKWQAMIYENGVMSGLKRRTAYAAYGVNDAGDIVGLLENMSPLAHAFLFSDDRLTDLGTMDGDPDSVSIAYGINSHRQIVGTGWINGNSQQRAFLYENGVMKDIGTLAGGYAGATAINNLGEIVGYSDASVFLYRNGTMIDLNQAIEKDATGIWPSISAVAAINDRGQIVGTAYLSDAQGRVGLRACLLTPITQ